MNARQKAKKYKRMYEALSAKSKPPIEFKVEEYREKAESEVNNDNNNT